MASEFVAKLARGGRREKNRKVTKGGNPLILRENETLQDARRGDPSRGPFAGDRIVPRSSARIPEGETPFSFLREGRKNIFGINHAAVFNQMDLPLSHCPFVKGAQ